MQTEQTYGKNKYVIYSGGVYKWIFLKTVLIDYYFAIECIVLTAIVLLQEGKSAGLGTISGACRKLLGPDIKDDLWKGALVKSTKFAAVCIYRIGQQYCNVESICLIINTGE